MTTFGEATNIAIDIVLSTSFLRYALPEIVDAGWKTGYRLHQRHDTGAA